MLRATPTRHVALPLYKVGLVVVRQFSRPVVQYAISRANEFPRIRRGFIHVGWCHYRMGVQLQRMVWGAEAQEAVAATAATSAVAAATVVGDAKTGGTVAEPVATPAATAAPTLPTATAASPTSTTRTSTPTTSMAKVRRLFIAPPRPSDDELLKKGMTLVVEIGLVLLLCGMLALEMSNQAAVQKQRREALEARFRKLEAHVDEVEARAAAAKKASPVAAAVAAVAASIRSATPHAPSEVVAAAPQCGTLADVFRAFRALPLAVRLCTIAFMMLPELVAGVIIALMAMRHRAQSRA